MSASDAPAPPLAAGVTTEATGARCSSGVPAGVLAGDGRSGGGGEGAGVSVELQPMVLDALERVVAVEQRSYSHPWSRRHFEDTIAAGHHARLLVADAQIIGYYVAMHGVDEVHLLNLTVAPEFQRQGWGGLLLEAMHTWARGLAAQTAWLEVRVSNTPALRLYERSGYQRVGLRRAYYPAARGAREDAVVMCRPLGVG